MISKYSFYRTELRVLQSSCKDNEEFLTKLADLIGGLSEKVETLNTRAALAEHNVRVLKNG